MKREMMFLEVEAVLKEMNTKVRQLFIVLVAIEQRQRKSEECREIEKEETTMLQSKL